MLHSAPLLCPLGIAESPATFLAVSIVWVLSPAVRGRDVLRRERSRCVRSTKLADAHRGLARPTEAGGGQGESGVAVNGSAYAALLLQYEAGGARSGPNAIRDANAIDHLGFAPPTIALHRLRASMRAELSWPAPPAVFSPR